MKHDPEYYIDMAHQLAGRNEGPPNGNYYEALAGILTGSVRSLCMAVERLELQLAEAIAAKEAIERQYAENYAMDQIADHNTLECEI